MEDLVDLRPTRAVEEREAVIELGLDETSLSFLQRVYRSVTQPMSRRMQAAMAALPHEHPKLGAVATVTMNGNDFAGLLERSILRSGKTAEVRQIELAPATAQGPDDHS
jgi:hypothetical protein